MKQSVLDRLETLPTDPGVYLMKDARGTVIYVGKAVNLRSRVRSYFRSGGDGRAFIPFLDTLLDEIEVIVVRTEQEALILENELIKQYSPKFNVLLRDDKSFICLKVDLEDKWPRLEVTRAVQMNRSCGRSEEIEPSGEAGAVLDAVSDAAAAAGEYNTESACSSKREAGTAGKGRTLRKLRFPECGAASSQVRGHSKVRLFGPYSSASSIRETLRVIERQFCLRSCSDRQMALHKAKGRGCLQYQMHRCSGPCVGAVTPEEYAARVRNTVLFLEGHSAQLLDQLTSQMNEAAEALDFEKAAAVRDRIRAISRSLERQRVVTEDSLDRDVAGIAEEGSRRVIYMLFIRAGRLIGGHAFPGEASDFPQEETLSSFLRLYYSGEVVIPSEILLPLELQDGEAESLECWLSRKKGARVSIRTPKRGAKADLTAMAQRNAQEALTAVSSSREETKGVLERLQKQLRLTRLPQKMECYDISLFQGDSAVGSGVCFVDGVPSKKDYRRYRIKTVKGTDDFAMLYEVLRRRAAHGNLPDLFLIDGGKGQLASAAAALADSGLVLGRDFDLASLAKSRLLDSDDRGEDRSDERVFLPDTRDPVVLDQRSPELLVLTRLRDEAHRFAITYHRLTRSKRALTSEMDGIEGVGRARRTKLLKHFGSMKRLKAASTEEIAAVPGIGVQLAGKIRAALDGLGQSGAEDSAKYPELKCDCEGENEDAQ